MGARPAEARRARQIVPGWTASPPRLLAQHRASGADWIRVTTTPEAIHDLTMQLVCWAAQTHAACQVDPISQRGRLLIFALLEEIDKKSATIRVVLPLVA